MTVPGRAWKKYSAGGRSARQRTRWNVFRCMFLGVYSEKSRFFAEGDDKTEKAGYIMENQLWKK